MSGSAALGQRGSLRCRSEMTINNSEARVVRFIDGWRGKHHRIESSQITLTRGLSVPVLLLANGRWPWRGTTAAPTHRGSTTNRHNGPASQLILLMATIKPDLVSILALGCFCRATTAHRTNQNKWTSQAVRTRPRDD